MITKYFVGVSAVGLLALAGCSAPTAAPAPTVTVVQTQPATSATNDSACSSHGDHCR